MKQMPQKKNISSCDDPNRFKMWQPLLDALDLNKTDVLENFLAKNKKLSDDIVFRATNVHCTGALEA